MVGGARKTSGIAISDVVFAKMSTDLQALFENAGARVLKNIAEPLKVWAFGGISETGVTSEPASVLLENFVEWSSSSFLGSEIQDAVAVEHKITAGSKSSERTITVQLRSMS